MPTFFSFNALLSQRSSGYKSTSHAIAEIVDNSLDAEANEVRVYFLERASQGRRHIEEILICDDGDGMDGETLQGALQFGATTNTDIDNVVAKKKKGKFGYGLPNASLSQCPNIHVYSWTEADKTLTTSLNLSELGETKSIEIPETKASTLPRYYGDIQAVINSEHGTIVSWRDCDRLSNTKARTIIDKSNHHLGRLFRHSFAQGKRIVFHQYRYDERKATYVKVDKAIDIIPNDPLFLMEDTVIAKVLWRESNNSQCWSGSYSKYSVSESKCKATSFRFEDHCYPFIFNWKGKSHKFEITTTVADLDIQKPKMRDGGQAPIGKEYAKKEREGNISFVRADREIASGHFGLYNTSDLPNRFWSIEVKFDADSDDLLGVHNNKQGIEYIKTLQIDAEEEWNQYEAELLQAKEQFWFELTRKIDEAIKRARAEIRRQQKEYDLNNNGGEGPGTTGGVPGGTSTTQSVIKEADGDRPCLFTEEQKTALLNRLREKFPSVPIESIKASINNYDQSRVRACIIYCDSESQQFWSISTVYDFLIVTINTNHEFYHGVLHVLRENGQESALTAIELFISSLAYEEHYHFRDDKEKQTLEHFRSYVGMHLNKYLKEFNFDSSEFNAESQADVK